MPYGFVTMGNNVGFFHVKNVHGGEDYTPEPGDEVSFIYDEYDKGAMDVQVLPTSSNFQSTPDIPICEVESHLVDESWGTVDSDSENEEVDDIVQQEMTRSEKEVTPCCSTDTEDNKREKGTVTLHSGGDGSICPDNFSGFLVYFNKSTVQDLGLTTMDRVTFICQPDSDASSFHFKMAKDVRLIDNG